MIIGSLFSLIPSPVDVIIPSYTPVYKDESLLYMKSSILWELYWSTFGETRNQRQVIVKPILTSPRPPEMFHFRHGDREYLVGVTVEGGKGVIPESIANGSHVLWTSGE